MVKVIENQVMTQKEFEMIRITDQVKEAVENSGVTNGMVAVITKHTTTGIMVNEALPCVEKDIELQLDRLVPNDYPYVHTHMLPTYGTCSGNAPGHLKSMLVGNHCIFPVIDGRMVTGGEQNIYFVEMDGLQIRKYLIEVIGD
ncbi:secondary thiamine-phosphate synthase enzyme YjbQ [Clostridium sp. AN503]|uniref:secondary thiamine-phosphate synthase enzyme YjbQ n=1 Tax=Clostridium sp. AN503 TaxID=3160598 RepID=UPI00345A2F01